MTNKLNKPYPYCGRNRFLRQSILTGLFVFLFLYIFKPFGLNEMEAGRLIRTTVEFGLISFAVSAFITLLLPLIFRNYYNEDSWTVYKEIINIVSILILIAVANYWYSAKMGFIRFDLQGFLTMFTFTLALGTIIVFAIVTFKTNRALKANLLSAQTMNQHIQEKGHSDDSPKTEQTILLASEIKKQNLSILPSQLIYITSVGNYLECIYLDDHGDKQSHKLRNRIKVIEETLKPHPTFFRCHRAFIINKAYIQSVEGNAKGYILSIENVDLSIPVARSKSKELQTILA